MFNTLMPVLQYYGPDTVLITQELRYQVNPRIELRIPLIHRNRYTIGLLSDGGSKPLWTHGLVGDRFDEFLMPYLFHDDLWTRRLMLMDGIWTPVDFYQSNELLYQMCIDICNQFGYSRLKATLIYDSVNRFGSAGWDRRGPINTDLVDKDNLGEDYAVLTCTVTPNFEAI